jgi:hypothetical protein
MRPTFSLALLLFIFATILSSCEEACDANSCQNNGVCVDGACV